jgi:hypothetical protein
MLTPVGYSDNRKKRLFNDQKNCSSYGSKVVFIGDSIVSNFSKFYPDMWEKDFPNAINLGIGGDRIENVWWRILNNVVPANAEHVVIHVGTNNIGRCDHHDIIQGLLDMIKDAMRICPSAQFYLSALLPRFDRGGFFLSDIDTINMRVRAQLPPSITFIEHALTLRQRKKSCYYTDGLHLLEEGYSIFSATVGNMIPRSISISVTPPPISISTSPPPVSATSYSIPLCIDDEAFESPIETRPSIVKKKLKGIVRRRASRNAPPLKAPTIPDFEHEYLPHSPKLNNSKERRWNSFLQSLSDEES